MAPDVDAAKYRLEGTWLRSSQTAPTLSSSLPTKSGCKKQQTGADHDPSLPLLPALHQGAQMKIYVASSWRNTFQPAVVSALRSEGHEVYDFMDSEGFHWSEVDPAWKDWPEDVPKYLNGLNHPCAKRGFARDMKNLMDCDACVYVMPCGVSASLEAGWAAGNGKPLIVYVPALREPDLMVKIANLITDDLDSVRTYLRGLEDAPSGKTA
jgi:hypothetical protein